ncbi:MAG: nucleotide exchange factor GrpE [Planctomycetota bacterium]|nr:MAG: nucleotide exchange factor GrpE [Planctomycetota bacterium]
MKPLIHDHEAILNQLRAWLIRTSEEMDSLAEPRAIEATDEGEPGAEAASDAPAELRSVGLLQLAEAFTALRHEIKLHTRGTRNLESMVEQSLSGLETASREFKSVQAKEREAADRAVRPVVEALIGLDEGILRAAKAFQSTCERIQGLAPTRVQERLDQTYQRLPAWRRWLIRGWFAELRSVAGDSVRQATGTEFASLMQGFAQIQLRLNRALQDLGIVRMNDCGGLIDPSQMTVVEIIESDKFPPETVVEVVRPGYSQSGRVIRFAEVRAVVGVRSVPIGSDDAI